MIPKNEAGANSNQSYGIFVYASNIHFSLSIFSNFLAITVFIALTMYKYSPVTCISLTFSCILRIIIHIEQPLWRQAL